MGTIQVPRPHKVFSALNRRPNVIWRWLAKPPAFIMDMIQ
jgi:hypothetical protein